MRRLPGLLLIATISCGGSSTIAPSNPPTSPTIPSPQTWTLGGTISDVLTGAGIAGATVAVAGLSTVTTNESGAWQLQGAGAAAPTLTASITAAGYVARDTRITWQQGGRSDVPLTLIPDRAPFSLEFYRHMVRNGLEEPEALRPLRRWSVNPNFYINTHNPRTGEPLLPSEVDLIVRNVHEAVSQITGGTITVGAVETGSGARAPRTGYINVEVVYEPGEDFCGRALVGVNPGRITLNYDRCRGACGNERISPAVVAHEVGHALGFWHVSRGVMTRYVDSCSNTRFTDDERLHARVAYMRPSGNTDLDDDPVGFSAASFEGGTLVTCPSPRQLAPRP